MSSSVKDVLDRARMLGTRGSYRDYNMYKTILMNVPCSALEYQEAIRELARILEV